MIDNFTRRRGQQPREEACTAKICLAYLQRGDVCAKNGRLEEAIQDYHAALWQLPRDEYGVCVVKECRELEAIASEKVTQAIDMLSRFFEPKDGEPRPNVLLNPGVLLVIEGCILARYDSGAQEAAIADANEVAQSEEWRADVYSHYHIVSDRYRAQVYKYDGDTPKLIYQVPFASVQSTEL